jgi:hypothetical protein
MPQVGECILEPLCQMPRHDLAAAGSYFSFELNRDCRYPPFSPERSYNHTYGLPLCIGRPNRAKHESAWDPCEGAWGPPVTGRPGCNVLLLLASRHPGIRRLARSRYRRKQASASVQERLSAPRAPPALWRRARDQM